MVLDGFRGKYAYLNDPAQGEVKVTEEEFDQAFTGIAIIPTPSDTFEPGGKQRSTVDFARKRLIGAGAAVSFVMITTAISYLFGIINSVSSRIFMDWLLTGINRDWLGPFLHLLILLAVIQLAVAWAQAVFPCASKEKCPLSAEPAICGRFTPAHGILLPAPGR